MQIKCANCNQYHEHTDTKYSRQRDKTYTDYILDCDHCGYRTLLLQEEVEKRREGVKS